MHYEVNMEAPGVLLLLIFFPFIVPVIFVLETLS